MNRINQLFHQKKNNILSVYYTAGFPSVNSTLPVLQSLENAGVDLVEVGIPFSDPLADGPVIQHSSEIALGNGMTMNLLFEQLKDFRKAIQIPVLLMGYLNPVLQFGMENFVKRCSGIGVDGVIIPDLPFREYQEQYAALFDQHELRNIFLISPQTSAERVRLIDSASKAFIYMVSSSSTTGAKGKMSAEQVAYFKRIKEYRLNNPTLTGFGISNHETYETACTYSNGAIMGSAFIKLLEESKNLATDIKKFIGEIRGESLDKKMVNT